MTRYAARAVHARRIGPALTPDRTRVLLRPFYPGSDEIAVRVIERIIALPDSQAAVQLRRVLDEFEDRHEALEDLFLSRWEEVRRTLAFQQGLPHALPQEPSADQKALLGAYFLNEYSFESAALFNPSIIPHPDQAGLAAGALRFILSLRATGEGHISSITFREGVVSAHQRITLTKTVPFVITPDRVSSTLYEKPLFSRKLQEAGLQNSFAARVLDSLADAFTLDDLRGVLAGMERRQSGVGGGILLLAESNFEVRFAAGSRLSQRVLFPSVPSQSNGIEDARFVRFRDEDDTFTYYATYTAYDGHGTLPQLLETRDFIHFKFITLNGPAVQNKGMALFPRRIDGRFAMLSRQDDENLLLMYSDNVHFWQTPKVILTPSQPWEFVKIGSCGSPIETEAGWLVLTHGVGPMRRYCLGAALLDLRDPTRVLRRLREPLLVPNEAEREGYVPNVVYTCGALLHDGDLIIPYAMSDYATSFATIPLDELLAGMD
jgi:predicted GH43/DUF377 family glycosyl hydrolase